MTRKQEQRLERWREATKRVTQQTTTLLWIFSLSSVGLFCASFIVPPTGVIDGSVLKAVAWFFALGALAEVREAVREGLGVKLTHGHTTIEVHDLDGPADSHHGGHGGYPEHHDYNEETEDTDDDGELV